MIDFDYLDYCLKKASWCIQYSSEPYISSLVWLKIVNKSLSLEPRYKKRQLQRLEWMQGTLMIDCIYDFGFKLCCVDWFSNVDSIVRSTIPEYSDTMQKLAGNRGLILCADCVIDKVENGIDVIYP